MVPQEQASHDDTQQVQAINWELGYMVLEIQGC